MGSWIRNVSITHTMYIATLLTWVHLLFCCAHEAQAGCLLLNTQRCSHIPALFSVHYFSLCFRGKRKKQIKGCCYFNTIIHILPPLDTI